VPKRRGEVHMTVRLERPVYRALLKASAERSREAGRLVSMNTLIRQALAEHLDLAYEPQPLRRGPRPKRRRSLETPLNESSSSRLGVGKASL
jgi:hypothetical protein